MKTRAAILWEMGKYWSVEEIDLDPPKHGEVLVQLVGSGEIDPGVTGVYPLERAADAHRVFENRAATGKLILAI